MVARPTDAPDRLNPGGTEDRDLTLAFQRGEKGAYQAIYDRHHARVHAVCRRMLINRDDADEATQEAFLRVYQALGRFNGRYQLGAWVTRIATNVCLDHLRAKTRRGGDMAAFELTELDACSKEDEGPEALAVRRSEGRRVRKVIASLPPLQRAAIVLRDFEGLSYDEIAMTLGITDQQVKALLHRARQRFKKNWISTAASALVPWRVVDRFRNSEPVAHESMSAPGLSAVAQIAPACSNVLHQCGQYVAERLAPTFAAFLLGGATATALVAPSSPARSADRPEVTTRPVDTSFDRLLATDGGGSRDRDRPARDVGDEVDAEEGGSTAPSVDEEAPAVEPTPSETPSPDPDEPSGESGGSGNTSGTIEGEATPPVVRAAFGFDRGVAIPWTEHLAPHASVDCGRMAVDQTIETRVWDGDASYPGKAVIHLSPYGLSVETTVYKGEHTVTYPASLYESSRSVNDDVLEIAFSGTYGSHRPYADAAGLPHSGSATATLTLDCDRRSVINEAMTFDVESVDDNS